MSSKRSFLSMLPAAASLIFPGSLAADRRFLQLAAVWNPHCSDMSVSSI